MAVYELAMSESSRLCTKLEKTFQQVRSHLNKRGFESRHMALESVLDLMQVLDRPDVRARLVQTLQTILDYLHNISSSSGVHAQRVQILQSEFRHDLEFLHASTTRLGSALFEDATLMLLRSHLNVHGQAAYQISSVCHLWKTQDDGLVFSCFQRWIEPVLPLERTVMRVMSFMREHYKTYPCEVDNGFSKWSLTKGESIFMVGIVVPNMIVPAVSSGQNLISVTFHTAQWGSESVLDRYEGIMRFEWMICSLPTVRRRL